MTMKKLHTILHERYHFSEMNRMNNFALVRAISLALEEMHTQSADSALGTAKPTAEDAVNASTLEEGADFNKGISELEQGRTISISWGVEDVKNVRKDLTDDQALAVLYRLKENHDIDVGINWGVIRDLAGAMFPKDRTCQ